jgi:xanthine dehydrogenase YagR molybdenum-binding subunit
VSRVDGAAKVTGAAKYAAFPLRHAETLVDGEIRMRGDPSHNLSLTGVLRGANEPIKSEITSIPDRTGVAALLFLRHSAVFVEIRLDEEFGMLRVVRVVSTVAAGRILNAKTARSQIMGTVVGGHRHGVA